MNKKALTIIGIIVLAIVIFGGMMVSQYNRVIGMSEAVDAQWAQVENQLQRRFDLIPNLVETVKGYAGHEKEVFTAIANARKAYFSADTVGKKAVAAGQMESSLSRLLLLQERYPNLKANESFLRLQDSLEGTENRISVERKRYNDSVRMLNTYIRGFPGRMIASWAGVEKAEYFNVPEAAKEVPKVNF